jgi:hypothetical protein
MPQAAGQAALGGAFLSALPARHPLDAPELKQVEQLRIAHVLWA